MAMSPSFYVAIFKEELWKKSKHKYALLVGIERPNCGTMNIIIRIAEKLNP